MKKVNKRKVREESLIKAIRSFSSEYFDFELEELCLKLVKLMADDENPIFMNYRVKYCASAIVYIVSFYNYELYDVLYANFQHKIIDDFFNITIYKYIRLVDKLCEKYAIGWDNKEFSIREQKEVDVDVYMDDNDDIFIREYGDFWYKYV